MTQELNDWKARVVAQIISGEITHPVSAAIVKAFSTWRGCSECVEGCPIRKGKTDLKVCPKFSVHLEEEISKIWPVTSCIDCGTDHHTCPPLRDEVWAQTGLGEGFLCWPCVESRIGRQLSFVDLSCCGWNSFAISKLTGLLVTIADDVGVPSPKIDEPRR